MYFLGTVAPRGVTLKSIIQMDVMKVDAPDVSVLNASPNGRYEMWGARLTAWTPEETGPCSAAR